MCPIEKEPEYILKSLSSVRKAIAERVSRSLQNIPQFDLHMDTDASALVRTRAVFLKKGENVTPSFSDMLIFCISRALEIYPEMNAHFVDEGIKQFKEINVGFAVATQKGVLLPVIRRANIKSLLDIAKESTELIKLGRNSLLRSSLQMHGTFTVSSLGGYGIDSFNAIISPPQVAALAMGTIIKKPFFKDAKILPVDILHLTLTVDHRAIDGALAANFMGELRSKIHNFNLQ